MKVHGKDFILTIWYILHGDIAIDKQKVIDALEQVDADQDGRITAGEIILAIKRIDRHD